MDMNNEVWKPVVGYEGIYEVSNMGRIKSLERMGTAGTPVHEKLLHPYREKHKGYMVVCLRKNNKASVKKIHRLVAEAFIPNDNLFTDTVNHIDEDKTNNRVDNLEWMSNGDNVRYSQSGWKHYRAKKIRCLNTGEVFGSYRDMERAYGLRPRAIKDNIKNGANHYKEYYFELI